jgi:hypothetical protein
LEGAVFLLLIAHLVERSPVSLILAVVLIVALARHIPTRAGVESWMEDQQRLIREEEPV